MICCLNTIYNLKFIFHMEVWLKEASPQKKRRKRGERSPINFNSTTYSDVTRQSVVDVKEIRRKIRTKLNANPFFKN